MNNQILAFPFTFLGVNCKTLHFHFLCLFAWSSSAIIVPLLGRALFLDCTVQKLSDVKIAPEFDFILFFSQFHYYLKTLKDEVPEI